MTPLDYTPPGSSCPWNSPGKNTGVGCHSLLQWVIPTQGSNQGLPIAGRCFTSWATREAPRTLRTEPIINQLCHTSALTLLLFASADTFSCSRQENDWDNSRPYHLSWTLTPEGESSRLPTPEYTFPLAHLQPFALFWFIGETRQRDIITAQAGVMLNWWPHQNHVEGRGLPYPPSG